MAVGEYWNTSVTTGTTWSGSVFQNLFELPEDSEEPVKNHTESPLSVIRELVILDVLLL